MGGFAVGRREAVFGLFLPLGDLIQVALALLLLERLSFTSLGCP
jgi:hypothetical protein